jgi:DNA-binding CsgD family transcriptional regulator
VSEMGDDAPSVLGRLLEREREVAALTDVIAGAAMGDARIVVVEGPAGIGKTRLLAEARRRAAEVGVRVLAARGGELEREFPFGVVRQLVEPALVGGDVREHALAGAAGAARPVLEDVPDEADGDWAGDPSFASLHGLFWLIVNLSSVAPLMLAVDDLHWCDRPSLRFLSYLVRRMESLRVVLVCSLRPSEPGADSSLLGEIMADPLVLAVSPSPLSGAAVGVLVGDRLGVGVDLEFAAACQRATGGNPLLLGELLKTLDSEHVTPDLAHAHVVADIGPRAVSRSVLMRLARLPDEAVAVARAVAVLGDGADMSAVVALGGIDEQAIGVGVAALMRAEIFQRGLPLGFAHPVVGAAVYEDMPVGERALAHERAATLLAGSGASVEQVAAQLLACPARGEAWVVKTLRGAARAALQTGAAESAVTYLTRALDEPPVEQHAEVLLELGRAEALTGGPGAVEHLRAAYAELEDPRARGAAAQLLARALLFTGHPAEGAEIAYRAASELPPDLSDLKDALEAFELVALCLFGAGDRAPLGRLERYRSRSPMPTVGAKMLAAVAALKWTSSGSADQCCALALEALADGDLIAADNGLASISAILVLAIADREEAMGAWEVSLAHAHSNGSLFAIAQINLWRGATMLWRGDLPEAEQLLRAAMDEFDARGYGYAQAQIYSDAYLASVLRERGDVTAARAVLDRSGDPGDLSDGARTRLHSMLEQLIWEGRFDEAVATAEEFDRQFGQFSGPAYYPWRSHTAVALDRLGRAEEARALAQEEVVLARRWGAPGTVARSLRILGTLERSDGLDHLREAVDVVAGSPSRLESAKALAALGVALRLARRPTDARAPLRQALELAEICGATGLSDHVRSELYATGARPRTAALTGVESLTSSERRVVQLAVDGMSNRDIAQALFVTPKTIEVHLTNAYRKLGIHSRRELFMALA